MGTRPISRRRLCRPARTKIKQTLVETSHKTKRPEIIEANFYIKANEMFHRISDKIKEETGSLDNKRIFFEWNEWLKKELKK